MSDETKKKISFDEMAFYYDVAIRNAINNLFTNDSEHGWTLEEFDKLNLQKAIENAVNPEERMYH